MSTNDAAVFAAARRHMVASQLLPNKVVDPRVIAAMSAVPRELFVPPSYRAVAYLDEDIPLAPGRYLMEPMLLARLLQAAEIEGQELVLVVGCASGYAAAVLSRLANTVVALESDAALVAQAQALLGQLGVDNVAVVRDQLAAGLADQAPYDVILIDGAVERVPDALTAQLAEGGRLIAVLREAAIGQATLLKRSGGLIARRTLFDAATPHLPGFAVESGFVF
jgi:protein-L-isoaspartate(D-aspartate) O-methyltransferase